VNLMRRPEVKRLVTVLMVMAMVTLMTGESGDASTPPTTGPHGAFFEKVSYFGLFRARRWMVFLTLACSPTDSCFSISATAASAKANPYGDGHAKASRANALVEIRGVRRRDCHRPFHPTSRDAVLLDVFDRRTGRRLDPAGEGLNVVVGFAGLLDLGYVAFYAIGAYITAWMTGVCGAAPLPPRDSYAVGDPDRGARGDGRGHHLGIPTLRLRGDYWPS